MINDIIKSNLEEAIHKIIQNEIAGKVWYQDKGCEDTLRRCLVNTERRLKVLFETAQKDLVRSIIEEFRGEEKQEDKELIDKSGISRDYLTKGYNNKTQEINNKCDELLNNLTNPIK